jgi:hypothetical protein
MDELNSILLLYNIFADVGRPGSLTYNNRGLVYQVHDVDGRFKGGRVPAHQLPSNPGRDFLDKRFAENKQKRGANLTHLKVNLWMVLKGKPEGWSSLSLSLAKYQIRITPFMNKEGVINELAFVDLKEKIAIVGASLGPEYTAKTVFSTIGASMQLQLPDRARQLINDPEEERRLIPSDSVKASQQLFLQEKKPEELQLSKKLIRTRRRNI